MAPTILKFFKCLIFMSCVWGGLLFAEGRLVIQSNAPAARVLLDGNYVATTNAQGQLQIDQLPDGRFLISIEKKGFQSAQQAVVIKTGQATVLRLTLKSLAPPPSRKSYRRPQQAGSNLPPKDNADSSRTITAAPTTPVTPPSPSLPPKKGHGLLYVALMLTAIAIFVTGFLVLRYWSPLRVRFNELHEPTPQGSETAIEDPASSVQTVVTPERPQAMSDFLSELEHREELLRAGFLTEPRHRRKKPVEEIMEEPTITLNKEDYDVKN